MSLGTLRGRSRVSVGFEWTNSIVSFSVSSLWKIHPVVQMQLQKSKAFLLKMLVLILRCKKAGHEKKKSCFSCCDLPIAHSWCAWERAAAGLFWPSPAGEMLNPGGSGVCFPRWSLSSPAGGSKQKWLSVSLLKKNKDKIYDVFDRPLSF